MKILRRREVSPSIPPSPPSPPLKSSFASWTLRTYYFLFYSSHSHLGGLYNLQNYLLGITMSMLESLCSFVVADCRGGVYQFPPKFSKPPTLVPRSLLLPASPSQLSIRRENLGQAMTRRCCKLKGYWWV